jgi:hypothetical protein
MSDEKEEKVDAEIRQEQFDEDYADSVEMWENTRKALDKGGKVLIRQQDIPVEGGGLKVRVVKGPYGTFAQAYVHMVQTPEGWKRVICRGNITTLQNSPKPQLDPENCPICDWALEHGYERFYPKAKFYFVIINRLYQEEQAASGLPNNLQIIEAGPQLWKAIGAVATHPAYLETVRDAKGEVVVDPETKKPKKRVNLSVRDLYLTKTTGKNPKKGDMDVEYGAIADSESYPLTDEEKTLIMEKMPKLDGLVTSDNEANVKKIEELLGGGGPVEEKKPPPSRVGRTKKEDSDRVPFDDAK